VGENIGLMADGNHRAVSPKILMPGVGGEERRYLVTASIW
jgi:hypothetical protein